MKKSRFTEGPIVAAIKKQMKFRIVLLLMICFCNQLKSQNLEIGIDYGRAYFLYKYTDYGTGLVKSPESNYGKTGGFTLRNKLGKNKFFETGLRFAVYEQYYSTRKYWGAWEQNYPVFFFPVLIGYQSQTRFGMVVSGGVVISVMPHQYTSTYEAEFVYPIFDSITRGTMYRSFTPVFPLLNVNAGFKYRINDKWQAELTGTFNKGFITITKYDIYYNDGSGSNDQRAKQTGTGDYGSILLGLKYRLDSKKDKSKRN